MRIDMTGIKYGRLTAIKYSHTHLKNAFWIFKCDCGNIATIAGFSVRRGESRSCGCLKKETSSKINFKHGHATNTTKGQSRLYRIWSQMKRRCYLKTVLAYPRYGGRGIKVCGTWYNNYLSFYKWAMETGYNDDLTIDRIDNNGNYEPENCRWITSKQQANNRKSNRLIKYKNKMMTMSEISDLEHINYKKLSYKINKGISVEDAVKQIKCE